MKVKQYIRNALDWRFNADSLIVSDKTPYETVMRDGLMSLRYYPSVYTDPASGYGTPILLVPPLGVPAWTFDLLEERSMVRFFRDQGYKVFLVDWGSPSARDAGLDFKNYVHVWLNAIVDAVLELTSVSKLSLVGYCMGGLMSLLIAAADSNKRVKNLVTIASPIDFHDATFWFGRWLQKLSRPLSKINDHLPFKLQEIPPQYFHMPGRMVSHLFRLTDPFGQLIRYVDLLCNMADRSYVVRHTALSRWFNGMLDYPGAMVQSVFLNMGLGNELRMGELKLDYGTLDLSLIKCSLLVVAGKSDKIVSIDSARSLLEVVSSEDKTFVVAPGGHAGVFAGEAAYHQTWQPIEAWLAQRS